MQRKVKEPPCAEAEAAQIENVLFCFKRMKPILNKIYSEND